MNYVTISYEGYYNVEEGCFEEVTWHFTLTKKEAKKLRKELTIYNKWKKEWLILNLAPIDCYVGEQTLGIVADDCGCCKKKHKNLITPDRLYKGFCYCNFEYNFEHDPKNEGNLETLKNIITSKFDYYDGYCGLGFKMLPMTEKIVNGWNEFPNELFPKINILEKEPYFILPSLNEINDYFAGYPKICNIKYFKSEPHGNDLLHGCLNVHNEGNRDIYLICCENQECHLTVYFNKEYQWTNEDIHKAPTIEEFEKKLGERFNNFLLIYENEKMMIAHSS